MSKYVFSCTKNFLSAPMDLRIRYVAYIPCTSHMHSRIYICKCTDAITHVQSISMRVHLELLEHMPLCAI